jgi:hypothetical protein
MLGIFLIFRAKACNWPSADLDCEILHFAFPRLLEWVTPGICPPRASLHPQMPRLSIEAQPVSCTFRAGTFA